MLNIPHLVVYLQFECFKLAGSAEEGRSKRVRRQGFLAELPQELRRLCVDDLDRFRTQLRISVRDRLVSVTEPETNKILRCPILAKPGCSGSGGMREGLLWAAPAF
jgi:hypothetical protein